MTHLIFDFETLDLDATSAAILSVAFCEFDPIRFNNERTRYTFQELLKISTYIKFEVTEQIQKYGRTISKSTLDFWAEQDTALRKRQMDPSPSDVSVTNLIPALQTQADIVWARGNSFDPVLVTSFAKQFNVPEPYPWWNVRDTRSYIEGLAFDPADPKAADNKFIPPGTEAFEKHDPVHDICMDIMRMQMLVGIIADANDPQFEDIPF